MCHMLMSQVWKLSDSTHLLLDTLVGHTQGVYGMSDKHYYTPYYIYVFFLFVGNTNMLLDTREEILSSCESK
jgi:hypothetical protein